MRNNLFRKIATSNIYKAITLFYRKNIFDYFMHKNTYKIMLVISSNNDTNPKNKLATKNANRRIRKGVILNWPLFLPTPITALTASFIKIQYCLET